METLRQTKMNIMAKQSFPKITSCLCYGDCLFAEESFNHVEDHLDNLVVELKKIWFC